MGGNASRVTVLGASPSFATMPEATLRAVMERTGISGDAEARLREAKRVQEAAWRRIAESGGFREYAAAPSPDALRGGAVLMDLPDLTLAYTPEEYAAHLRGVAALSAAHPGYCPVFLENMPFSDMRIVSSDDAVAVCRLRAPYLTVVFEHPALCRAFGAYAEGIRIAEGQTELSPDALEERLGAPQP